jgi:hypothetical protein
MKFTNREPKDWKNLQDLVAEYLSVAGYKATTLYEIETVRGKVEIDVYVESPYELVKHIVFECKYWNSSVTKEKIHAFRTVVLDSGAELGVMISKNGYQSGAIEAAEYSNVRLETWNSFLKIIEERWIDNRLRDIKTMTAMVMNYCDEYEFESERLSEKEYSEYKSICSNISKITSQSLLLRKMDLCKDSSFFEKYASDNQSSSKEEYLDFLSIELKKALNILEKLSVKPNKPNRYRSILRFIMEDND